MTPRLTVESIAVNAKLKVGHASNLVYYGIKIKVALQNMMAI